MAVTISALASFVFGALAVGLGAYLIAQERRRRRQGAHAMGVVVDRVYGAGSGPSLDGRSVETADTAPILDTGAIKITPAPRPMGHPVVEFRTASGTVVRFRSSYESRPPAHAVGDTVAVLYDAADPQKAELAGQGTCLSLVLLGMGLVAVAIAAVLWTFAR